MEDFETFYDVLEVDESASQDEIKSAFRRLANEYHPDKVPEHLTRVRKDAEEKFKRLNEARGILGSVTKRAQYDALLEELRTPASQNTAAPTSSHSTAQQSTWVPPAPPPPPPPPPAPNPAGGSVHPSSPPPPGSASSAAPPSVSAKPIPVWARVVGCVAGFVFAEIAGPVVARVMLSVQSQPTQWLGGCGVAWLFANTILVGVFVTGAVSERKRMAKWAATGVAGLTVLLAILVAVAADRGRPQIQAGSPVSTSVAFPPDKRPKASVTSDLIDQMAKDIPEVRTCLNSSTREEVLAALDTEVLRLKTGRTTFSVSGAAREPCRLFGARMPLQWIYEKTSSGYRQLLDVGPVDSVIVLRGVHNGYKDIQLSSSYKAGAEVLMETYVFEGQNYRSTGDGQSHPIVPDAGTAGGNPNQLPQPIRKALDDEYPGWFFPTVSSEDLKLCRQPNSNFSPGLVWGDFDGDGARDYGVAIQQGERRYTLAFLSRGSGFARFVLEPGGWNILGVARKDERLPRVGQDARGNLESKDPVTLQNDALIGLKCESSSVAYLYTNGTFQYFFMSD